MPAGVRLLRRTRGDRLLPRRPQGLRRRGCEEVMAMRIGFVGLGNMGRPMAANLAAAGHEMIVGDLNRAAVDDFVATPGARPANGLASLPRNAEIVINSVPNGQVVSATPLGTGGSGGLVDVRAGGQPFI